MRFTDLGFWTKRHHNKNDPVLRAIQNVSKMKDWVNPQNMDYTVSDNGHSMTLGFRGVPNYLVHFLATSDRFDIVPGITAEYVGDMRILLETVDKDSPNTVADLLLESQKAQGLDIESHPFIG